MEYDFNPAYNYTVIKGKFKALSTSSFGLFIIFIDNSSKMMYKYQAVASHFSTVFENSINMPWNEFDDLISQMKWKGEYAATLTNDIQATVEDMFESGMGRAIDIWENIADNHLHRAVHIIEEYFSRPTADKNVKVEIGIEMVNLSDIENVQQAKEYSKAEEMLSMESMPKPPTANTTKESSVILDVSLVLSPVSGIPLTELKQGDKILVKISDATSRGQYFIDLLDATEDNQVVPIPAVVDKVTLDGKLYNVTVNIGPGIYGLAVEEDNVKAKRYDPNTDTRKKKQPVSEMMPPNFGEFTPTSEPVDNLVFPSQQKEKKSNSMLIFIIIGGLTLLLLVILIFLML